MRGLIILAFALFITVAKAGDGYRLVWADEFNVDGPPDPKNWGFETGFVRNEELQWYQPQNAFCEAGMLIIEARRERRENPKHVAGSVDWTRNREAAEYTSACVITRDRHAWQYGRFEIRARLRPEAGLWPAIWFLGVAGRWPNNGEIDLMEFYDDAILANACWGSTKPGRATWDSSKTPMAAFNDPQWGAKFHVWRMDWDERSIKLFLDDKLLNEIDVAKATNPESRGPRHPFRQPAYLLLNLAIGGLNGGDPSATVFPARYEIDYVRVSQK